MDEFIPALKLTWLQKLQSFSGNWIDITKLYFDKYKLFNCSYHYALNTANRIWNPFWVDVLKSFSLYCNKLDLNTEEFLYYPLFYNPNILIGNKSFFFKSWFDAGIHCIGDIFKNGTFIPLDEINRMYNLTINSIHYTGVKKQ